MNYCESEKIGVNGVTKMNKIINQYLKLIFILYLIIIKSSNSLSLIAYNQREIAVELNNNNNNNKTNTTTKTYQNSLQNFVPIFLSDNAVSSSSSSSSSLSNRTDNITTTKTAFFNSFYINSKIPINKNQPQQQQQQVPFNSKIMHSVASIGIFPSSSIEQKSITSLKNPLNRKDNLIMNNNLNELNSQKFLQFIKQFDIRLKNIQNVELGVTYIQEIFDTMNFTLNLQNDTEHIKKISQRIKNKLQKALNSINYLHNDILNEIEHIQSINKNNDTIYLSTIIQPCPYDDFTIEQNYYNKKQIEIINYLKFDEKYLLKQHQQQQQHQENNDKESTLNITINIKIINELKNLSLSSSFKHVYFLSRFDHASDHYCQYYFNDQNFRFLYISQIQHKHIFLLIDNGNSYNDEQFELTRTFVTDIIHLLDDNDYLTIILISDNAVPIQLKYNKNNNEKNILFMYQCTMDNRKEFLDIVEHQLNYMKNATTNHTLGFEYSFELLQNHNLTKFIPIEFLYITRGILSRLTDAKNVLFTIAKGQKLLKYPIKINTCAVTIDEKRIMYERQFLRDIAKQNFSKYDIDVSDWYNSSSSNASQYDIIGNMFVITKRHPERLIKTSCAIFETLFHEKFIKDQIKFHQPVLDYNTKDFIVSITRPLKNYGVLGVNILLNDLIEDIIYFKKFDDMYAFIIDINGIVIYHPAYLRPIATLSNNFPVDIFYLENSNTLDFYKIRKRILNENQGNVTVFNDIKNKIISYTWERILDAYIVCIVSIGNRKPLAQFNSWFSKDLYYHQSSFSTSTTFDLLYHRIDLIPPQTNSLCRHFRQIATLDSETVFLSASSFQSPFAYLKNNKECKNEICIHNSRSIIAYIKDITNLLANPGLLPFVRNDIIALYSVMSYLKKRHQESGTMKKYIIRRYIATMNGVILLYPGSVLGIDLEPSKRPWYRKAMKFPGKIVVTEPYLDAGGAGYIVTIAHTIYQGRINALHNAERDRPIAIVAIDVPYGFFYKIVLDSFTFCSDKNIKCILIEDEGYVIAHPSILEPSTLIRNKRRPLEHITHKESFIANDMLNHKNLVLKKLCANYQNRKIQRYYTFNTSLTETLTNIVNGEKIRYQIRAIHGTNIFAIILNTTCNDGAFCPCSTVDRVCLNCNRMDQTDCECPCECSLKIPLNNDNIDDDDNMMIISKNIIPYCEAPSENFDVVNSLSYDWNMVLKSCSNINCELYSTQMDCLGVMGCEWCQLDVDGNPFLSPFCTTQTSCFNGILGSITPYGDGELGSVIADTTIPSTYSAIGPVGGAIIALCLVVGFAIYCYRQNLDNISEDHQFYAADSQQEENYGLQLSSRFNFDDTLPHDDSDLSGSPGNYATNLHKNLAVNPIANAISPYHMSSGGYRRPNGESDHGYSTMTPHEDSEHMCFTLVEPLINNKQKRNSFSADSISIHTSSASSTFNQDRTVVASVQQQSLSLDKLSASTVIGNELPISFKKKKTYDDCPKTIIPEQISSPHHILAPVTVHRHMEAS